MSTEPLPLHTRRGQFKVGDRVGELVIVDRNSRNSTWILACPQGHTVRRRSAYLAEKPDYPCRKCAAGQPVEPAIRPIPLPQPIDARLLESLDLRLRVSARAIAESLDYPSVRSLARHLARTGHAPLGRLLAAMEKGGQP